MKNRGFTLIELLAVITILTIILLITFASIGSVVRNSKNNLHNTQINQIKKAAEYYNNKEGLKDYDICINVEDLIDKGYIKQDEVKDPKSEKSIDGSVIISYNGRKYSYEYKENVCLCKTNENELSMEIGTKYTCEVKKGIRYNFYVLSTNDDGTINLIMDRSICENGTTDYADDANSCLYQWSNSSTSNFGPNVAMAKLYNATKHWDNVPDSLMNYTDVNNINFPEVGYTGIVTNKQTKVTTIKGKNGASDTVIGKSLKARLPETQEVVATGCKSHLESNPAGSCPSWIVDNMTFASDYPNNSSNVSGTPEYNISNNLLLSTYSAEPSFIDVINYEGFVGYGQLPAGLAGIRPVITISMSSFAQK